MEFSGKYQRRSSKLGAPSGEPPGEKEICELNPQRRDKILEVTKWKSFEPGSLNLHVTEKVLNGLKQLKPTITELGSTVRYPPPYEDLPILRKEYWYYLALAWKVDKTKKIEVLVRRAKNPAKNLHVVELFSAKSLCSELKLSENDTVYVKTLS